jgi:hypothetical protein
MPQNESERKIEYWRVVIVYSDGETSANRVFRDRNKAASWAGRQEKSNVVRNAESSRLFVRSVVGGNAFEIFEARENFRVSSWVSSKSHAGSSKVSSDLASLTGHYRWQHAYISSRRLSREDTGEYTYDMDYSVGSRVLVKLYNGKVVEAEITAITNQSTGRKLRIAFGDVIASINPAQITEVLSTT